MSTREIIEEFESLSLDEKLRLLDALWNQVVPHAEELALRDADRQALAERLRDIEADQRPHRDVDHVVRDLLDPRDR